MTTYRLSATFRSAALRAMRQRAAMRYTVGALANVGKKPLSLRGIVHSGVQS